MEGEVVTNDIRRASLKELISTRKCLRVMEAHSPLSALIAENTKVETPLGMASFDALWSSSLTDSTVRALPDNEILPVRTRLTAIQEMFDVTTKPLIVDGDSGGIAEHFGPLVRGLERAGVSAVIIEDKTGLKRNSLLGTDVVQHQEAIDVFCEKISAGKRAQMTSEFMIVARIESLILDRGMADALERSHRYVEAGADAIMIHSRKRVPQEVFEFAESFRRDHPDVPLVCVPTSYNEIHFDEFVRHGFNVVIYANHMLRASYPAMKRVAESILTRGCSSEADDMCMSIDEILSLIPGTR
ncbi:phosphoenolpyruvate mutase [Burkholderia cenocepacia]|nr:phosphoenolpyruvate mutase [Burkholderia cenocepacia]HDR9880362.1 phosphoenolpyruvate mutase [Burkholderia cenocepacia]HDR9887653.1 phosphoenolpyruvate mutase [Burkholderia cenocepacia]